MDATKPNIPDPDQIERELAAASAEHDDGKRYVRASVAARIIGVGPGLQTRWIRDGRIMPMRFRVPRGPRAPRGILTAWPLNQAIVCARRYWTNSNRKWTEEEDEFLLAALGELDHATIAAGLQRSACAIAQRATDLGYTQRNAQGLLTTGEVARLCGVSREAVNNWCLKMARPLRFSRVPSADRAKLISTDDLRGFFKANPASFERLSKQAQARIDRVTMTVHQRRKAVAA
jgi:DNA-binding transcriptional regulator YdaS (Cro superfamily)